MLSSVPFRPGKPTFVIAHTHKGHPISFMSNNVAWHHKVPSADQLTLLSTSSRMPPIPGTPEENR